MWIVKSGKKNSVMNCWRIDRGSLDADAVLSAYCALLHQRHHTFEEVARRTNLDARTVKKYLNQIKVR
jgi:hypothetical protein